MYIYIYIHVHIDQYKDYMFYFFYINIPYIYGLNMIQTSHLFHINMLNMGLICFKVVHIKHYKHLKTIMRVCVLIYDQLMHIHWLIWNIDHYNKLHFYWYIYIYSTYSWFQHANNIPGKKTTPCLADVQALKELLVRNAWVAMPGEDLWETQAFWSSKHGLLSGNLEIGHNRTRLTICSMEFCYKKTKTVLAPWNSVTKKLKLYWPLFYHQKLSWF